VSVALGVWCRLLLHPTCTSLLLLLVAGMLADLHEDALCCCWEAAEGARVRCSCMFFLGCVLLL
jgi:hypothetical protein